MSDYVQVRNPKSDRWVKVDRELGLIVGHKKSPGPYKGVPVAEAVSIGRVPFTAVWDALDEAEQARLAQGQDSGVSHALRDLQGTQTKGSDVHE